MIKKYRSSCACRLGYMLTFDRSMENSKEKIDYMESLFNLGLQKGLINFDEEGNSTKFIQIV